MIGLLVHMAENRRIPDALCRLGIRALLRGRLRRERARARKLGTDADRWVRDLAAAPIALSPDLPNVQHYEVPVDFFRLVLGPHMKYSSCFWEPHTSDLEGAEAEMLELTCRRAGIENGMRVLDLGCGWGSLSLWLARHFPETQVTALSNSRLQGQYIRARAQEIGARHLEVITADINTAVLKGSFDRVISIEMFEHMRNYDELLYRVAGWLVPDGKLFVHIFCHRTFTYPFTLEGAGDWMARYFFTAGLMPSAELLPRFDRDLVAECQWNVCGTHYARTARAWLERLDTHDQEVIAVFREFYGQAQATIWLARWRLFFMACEELFGYKAGMEWHVAHYLFGHRDRNT